MFRLTSSPSASFCLFLVAVSAGCGKPSYLPDLGTVTGTINLDGQPLANALVWFTPANGRPSGGTTNDNGQYTLEYSVEYPGAVPGTHTVRITRIDDEDDPLFDPDASPIPAGYNTESTLKANVQSGSNVFDFDLRSDTSAP